MKIFIQYWNADGEGSALDCFTEIVKALSRSFDVTVLLPRRGRTSAALGDCRILYLPVLEPDGRSLYLGYLRTLLSALRHLWSADLLYVFDYNFWKPSFLFAARLLSVPVVNHVRYILPALLDPGKSCGALAWSNLIICNSQATARRVNFRLPRVRTEVAYNFIPEHCVVPPRTVAGHRIGYVGALLREKGLETLFRALPLITSGRWELKIYGPEKEPGFQQDLQSLAKELGVESRVTFHGYVADREKIFNSFDLLVLPSWEEAFGFVLLEAAIYSVPVVASDSGAIPEIVRHGTSGYLVPPRDEQRLAEAVSEILNNPAKQSAMGSCAREKILREFSAAPITEKLSRILREVAG